MSQKYGCEIQDYSRFDKMAPEELKEILRMDALLTDTNENDTEMILYIMELLAKRSRESGERNSKSPQEALGSFRKNYLHCCDSSEPLSADSNAAFRVTKRNPVVRHFLRACAACAAVFVVLFFGTMTAYAFGINLWETVAEWTRYAFRIETTYIGEDDGIGEPGQPNAQEGNLRDYSIPNLPVPNWIPDGYELIEVTISRMQNSLSYTEIYHNGSETLTVFIITDSPTQTSRYEKDSTPVEVYKTHGITFYLMSNIDRKKAVWIQDGYECSISGVITREELIKMIDSIFD